MGPLTTGIDFKGQFIESIYKSRLSTITKFWYLLSDNVTKTMEAPAYTWEVIIGRWKEKARKEREFFTALRVEHCGREKDARVFRKFKYSVQPIQTMNIVSQVDDAVAMIQIKKLPAIQVTLFRWPTQNGINGIRHSSLRLFIFGLGGNQSMPIQDTENEKEEEEVEVIIPYLLVLAPPQNERCLRISAAFWSKTTSKLKQAASKLKQATSNLQFSWINRKVTSRKFNRPFQSIFS